MARTTLTKTERKMLEQAANHPHGVMWAMRYYITGTKAGLVGTRGTDAIRKLEEKGFVANVTRESYTDAGRYRTVYSTEVEAFITDAGRAALSLEINAPK